MKNKHFNLISGLTNPLEKSVMPARTTTSNVVEITTRGRGISTTIGAVVLILLILSFSAKLIAQTCPPLFIDNASAICSNLGGITDVECYSITSIVASSHKPP